ncbi:hypothetical protein F4778DRAFT_727298 [Xylariomycetidae sp. FL2044]|nr:hypothetical protein F4778DRAFT_727298 [Xylariomycetidae sp. FL2044]
MASLTALRNHIPQQFDKFDRFTNRSSSAQKPQPPTTNGQSTHSDTHAGSQQTYSQRPSPDAAKSIELKPRGHTMVASTADGSPLLTITFASSSTDEKAPDLIVLRGNGAGDEIASAQFHKWHAKTDMHINGRKIKIRKDFSSGAGLGKARWEKDGRKAMKLISRSSSDKEVVARFEAVGKSKMKKGTGQFEILRDGLAREQLEEVVISCLVERERMRRDGELRGELLQDGVWELFMASLGFP